MRKLLIGAAAIALAASGAMADPGGKGGGGGGGKGGGHAEHAQSGGGGGGQAKGQGRGGQDKADRGPAAREAKADRGPAARVAQAERGNGKPAKAERGNAGQGKADRGNARADRGNVKADRGNGNGQARVVKVREERGGRDVRVVRDNRDYRDYRDRDGRIIRTNWFDGHRSRIIDGCPPGLAKKNNGCMPPGLARDRNWDWRESYYQPSWWGYRSLGDGRYYYNDGYLYRIGGNNSVLGYIPLLGGALSIGNPWPSYYDPYEVPDYYENYYNLGAPNSYRYADDVLYRVDPGTDAITSIAALLTGDQFAVGQPMPAGYDVYNVPYGYQDEYYDSDEANYRYADGYVYQVDPTTQLVQAIIELIV